MKNKYAVITLTAILCLSPLNSTTEAEEKCSDVLQFGVWATDVIDRSGSVRDSLEYWLCDQSLSTVKSQASSRDKFGLNIKKILGFDFGSSRNRSRFSEFKNIRCGQSRGRFEAYKVDFILRKYADPSVIEAWSSCVARDEWGLYCWADELDSQNMAFHVRWIRPEADVPTPRVASSSLRGGRISNISDVAPGELLPKDYALPVGDEIFDLQRTSEDVPIVIVLNSRIAGRDSAFSKSCKYFIPAPARTLAWDEAHWNKTVWN